MRILYFDCFSGAAGDMILGSLLDSGVSLDDVRGALGGLAIAPDTIWTERVTRAGITATKLHVAGETLPRDHAHDHQGGHGHDAGHQHEHADHGHTHAFEERHQGTHRTLAEIARLIDGSALSTRGKARSKELFHRLGEAEAAVHGTTLDQVHFHEVGALDSIIDIVGTVFALETLGVDRIVASPLNVGAGSIRSAHGLYPVPAPATLRLLEGVPVYAGTQKAELVTPTGALLIGSYAQDFGPLPAMRIVRSGYGAGSRDFPDTPNVVRAVLGETEAVRQAIDVVVIEAEIDDMNPQIFGVVMDALLAAGALDVFYTAIQMKKNRPGTLLTVIARPEDRDALTSIVFRETTTIGVRYRVMARECLDREVTTVRTAAGAIRVKVARRDGEILNVSPEFDDCVRASAESGRPVKEIQAMALKAFYESGS